MSTFYNSAQPINIKDTYDAYDVVEFLVRMPSGRQCKKGSMRINGFLKVEKTSPAGVTSAIDGTEGIYFNQYVGAHSFFRNLNVTVNGRTIESLQNYPRYVGMISQHDGTPETMITSSAHAVEVKGCLNNRLLVGSSPKGCPFSIKPHISINKSSDDLPQSKYQDIKIMFQLGSAIESLYITGGVPQTPTISALAFHLSDLQLSWMEAPEMPGLASQPTVFNTVFNMVQTIVSLNSNITINSPTAYDSLSMSFLRQANLNTLYKDSLLCEYVPDINRVEYTINGQDGPLTYPILPPCYQDIGLNYHASLSNSGNAIWGTSADGNKNAIMNRFLNENGSFGVGCAFKTSINDKLQVALTIDDNTDYQPSSQPIDAYIYINGFLTL